MGAKILVYIDCTSRGQECAATLGHSKIYIDLSQTYTPAIGQNQQNIKHPTKSKDGLENIYIGSSL